MVLPASDKSDEFIANEVRSDVSQAREVADV
jgi:hypothetical protein